MPTFLGNPRSPIGAVSRSADKLDIFAVADDGNVYTAAWEPDFGSWHGWYLIGGATFPPGAPVYAVSRSAEKLDQRRRREADRTAQAAAERALDELVLTLRNLRRWI